MTKVTVDTILIGNTNDNKKQYIIVIGLQFKPSGALIGYLQLETASTLTNNEKNNFLTHMKSLKIVCVFYVIFNF